MQASNFRGVFDQDFLWIFYETSQKMPFNIFYTMVQKSQKTKTSVKRIVWCARDLKNNIIRGEAGEVRKKKDHKKWEKGK